MISTIEWALLHNESVDDIPPSMEWFTDPYPRTARDIAVRAIILQNVIDVAYNLQHLVDGTDAVDAETMITWFQKQGIWEAVTPQEKAFLLAPTPTLEQGYHFQQHQEAEWTLLWMIGKVEALGLPTHFCDGLRLADETIMPGLLTDLEPFLSSAELRDPTVIVAEDLRTYNFWCYAHQDRRHNRPLPVDLNLTVLYERRYAFEWLDGTDEWDHVTCDA
jgi:hypothetical protein